MSESSANSTSLCDDTTIRICPGPGEITRRKLLTAETHTDSAPSSVAEIKDNALLDRMKNS